VLSGELSVCVANCIRSHRFDVTYHLPHEPQGRLERPLGDGVAARTLLPGSRSAQDFEPNLNLTRVRRGRADPTWKQDRVPIRIEDTVWFGQVRTRSFLWFGRLKNRPGSGSCPSATAVAEVIVVFGSLIKAVFSHDTGAAPTGARGRARVAASREDRVERCVGRFSRAISGACSHDQEAYRRGSCVHRTP
jgi:hypothetical protein